MGPIAATTLMTVVASLGVRLVAAAFLEISFVALVWPTFLLQRTVRLRLGRLEVLWLETSNLLLLTGLGFFQHIIERVSFLICG